MDKPARVVGIELSELVDDVVMRKLPLAVAMLPGAKGPGRLLAALKTPLTPSMATDAELIVMESVLDKRPLLETLIDAVPGEAIRLLLTIACTCVELTKVEASGAPFQVTCEPPEKFEPKTVNVKEGPLATAQAGDRLLTPGTGAAKPETRKIVPSLLIPPYWLAP
jgi:hypothetical protein